MIRYIKGEIVETSENSIIIECGGIGYYIMVTTQTMEQIKGKKEVKIFTYLKVKEDSHSLFGFSEIIERQMFERLISVSGIGVMSGLMILSSMDVKEVRDSIISENVAAFKKVKGVGPKTAKRIILDLKDKIIKDGGDLSISVTHPNNTIRTEALSALIGLQFNKIKVQKALNQILSVEPDIVDVETLIKKALKILTN